MLHEDVPPRALRYLATLWNSMPRLPLVLSATNVCRLAFSLSSKRESATVASASRARPSPLLSAAASSSAICCMKSAYENVVGSHFFMEPEMAAELVPPWMASRGLSSAMAGFRAACLCENEGW